MSFYANLAATAARLIADKGQSMTLTREHSGSYDPATGQHSTSSTQYTFNGLELAASKTDDAFFEESALVEGRARVILAEVPAVEPLPGDTISYGLNTLNVQGVTRQNPAGTALIYKIRGTV
jgi:hypothetical protein